LKLVGTLGSGVLLAVTLFPKSNPNILLKLNGPPIISCTALSSSVKHIVSLDVSFKQYMLRATGYPAWTWLTASEKPCEVTFTPRLEKLSGQLVVTLLMNVEIVSLVHAGMLHMPVNQLFNVGTMEVFALLMNNGASAPALKQDISGDVRRFTTFCSHADEAERFCATARPAPARVTRKSEKCIYDEKKRATG